MKQLNEYLTERSLGDDLADWFDKTVHMRDYKDALEKLKSLIQKKKNSGNLRHSVPYYAEKIARSYRNVEQRPLMQMYDELVGEDIELDVAVSSVLFEKAPPSEEAEQWIKANKDEFKNRYGAEEGEKILYAKAWKMFG